VQNCQILIIRAVKKLICKQCLINCFSFCMGDCAWFYRSHCKP